MTDRKPTRARGKPVPTPVSPNGQPVDATTVVAGAVEPGDPQPMTHPAVVVMRVPTDQPGQERVELMEINGIDPLSVPTLLRMAASIKEQQLGLAERR